MQIKKITLKDGGFKGAEIVFLRPEEKRNKTFINEVTEKRKNPVQLDLERPFKDLRYHFLMICGIINESMEKTEKDFIISDSEVEGIEMSDEFFVLSGNMKTQFGNKRFKLKTPKMDSGDNYMYYDTILKIIDTIVTETELYMTGKKEVSNEEIAIRYIQSGKDKNMSMDVMKNMTPEEIKEYCVGLLEGTFGCIVTDNEDFDFSDVEEIEMPESKPALPTDAVIHFNIEDNGTMEIEDVDDIIIDAEEIKIPVKK